MNSNLVSYAMDCASFLVLKNHESIKQIILFGSVGRNEASNESDIDLFIETFDEKGKADIMKANDQFLRSIKVTGYWRLLAVTNPINIIIGRLDDYGELESSIIANGIVLYAKYAPRIKGGKHSVLFVWENVQPNTKRVLLNKQLFGYRQRKKFYSGAVQKFGGERLGKGCILLPLESSNMVHALFKAHKVSVRIKKIVAY